MLDTIALVAITIVVTLLLCKATGLFNGKTGATGPQGVAGEPGKPGTQEDLKSALAIFLGKVKQHDPTCQCEKVQPVLGTPGRYLLFSGKDYYPLGGWKDFKGAFNELREAIYAEERQYVQPLSPDGYWYHIVDSYTGETVVTQEDAIKAYLLKRNYPAEVLDSTQL